MVNTAQSGVSLRSWLDEGPFTLVLSAGFFGFYAHCGFLGALEDAGVAPTRVSGSSAGALVSGLWASGLESGELREVLEGLRREDFWDPAPGLGLLRGRRFGALLDELLPVSTIEEARVPASFSVYDVLTRRTRALSSGSLNRAIRASCALPGLFQPVWVERRPMLDGGILDRMGFAGLQGGERVLYHHLSSRSPWRRKGSPALEVPRREGMVTLALDDLPRVNPFKLERGPRAMDATAQATRRALEAPIVDGVVRLSVR